MKNAESRKSCKKLLTNKEKSVILTKLLWAVAHDYGGIAQLARASGSYPAGRWFKSDFRYLIRPVGQAVKTRPFHGCNMGSIPVRVRKKETDTKVSVFFF